MRKLVLWLRRLIGAKESRREMTSRINTVSLLPNGNVRKQAGDAFTRGEYHYDPVILLRREASFLRLLDGRRFPVLLEEGDDWFSMTYCGNELSKSNLPEDWRQQVEEIAAILDEAKIVHRDIKPGNVTVLDGRLQLIDFGWAIRAGELPYVCPRELCPDVPRKHIYDNRAALEWVVSTYAS